VVAAGLVGTVVILVGFASGLGITRPAPASAGTNQQAAGPTGGKPAGQADSPATGSGTGGVIYVGTPQAAGLTGVPWPSWLTNWPSISGSPSGPGIGGPPPSTPSSPVGPTGSAPTMPGPTTPPNCQVGLVQSVLATTTSVVNGIPLIGGLTGGLIGGAPSTSGPANPGLVGGLANTLIGSCPPPPPTTATMPSAPTTAPAPVVLPAPADLVTTTPVAGP
jgi:hypothetical protein